MAIRDGVYIFNVEGGAVRSVMCTTPNGKVYDYVSTNPELHYPKAPEQFSSDLKIGCVGLGALIKKQQEEEFCEWRWGTWW